MAASVRCQPPRFLTTVQTALGDDEPNRHWARTEPTLIFYDM
jgi:hypothetical protein